MKFNTWDLFTRIKNGQRSKKRMVQVPKQTLTSKFLKILWDDGFILGYQDSKTKLNCYDVFLKYKNQKSVLKQVVFVSKPGKREYFNVKQIWKLTIGTGSAYFSTNKGILSLVECKKQNVGGELFVNQFLVH